MVGGYQTTLEVLGLAPRSDIGEKGNAQESGGLVCHWKIEAVKTCRWSRKTWGGILSLPSIFELEHVS